MYVCKFPLYFFMCLIYVTGTDVHVILFFTLNGCINCIFKVTHKIEIICIITPRSTLLLLAVSYLPSIYIQSRQYVKTQIIR